MDELREQSAQLPDCDPHDGHGHTHGDDCGHASIAHGEHMDYIHDTHRHAQHDGHWDEHSPVAAMEPQTVGRPSGVG
jgi:hypothetical protein